MIKLFLNIAIILSLIITIGCFNKNFIRPKQTEIDAYIANHPDLPEIDKACIYDGRFEVGMQQETLRFLLGPPKEIEIIQQPWAQQEKWIYKAGNFKIFYIEDNGVVGIEEK